MNTPLVILVIAIALPFVILQIVLPARAGRRNRDVNEMYPAFRFIYPVLLTGIAALELLNPRLFGANRIGNLFLVGVCLYSIAALWQGVSRQRAAPPQGGAIVLTAVYGVFAVLFAVIAFQ